MTKFVDAQEMHKAHPKTFLTPSVKELNNIKPGDIVKVACDAERFWVKVETVSGNETTGTVDNYLLTENAFKFGDKITFEKRNVFDIVDVEARNY